MFEHIMEVCRSRVATLVVRRANNLLKIDLEEDAQRGIEALDRCLRVFAAFPDLQGAIADRVIFRPPSFVLARDNELRSSAAELRLTLVRIRELIAAHPSGANADLIREIDRALGDRAQFERRTP
jgi:hypothetical protein